MSFNTDSPLGKLHKFVAVDEAFGYVEDVETAYQVLREFETITTTRFCSFYSKDFGKQDQGGQNRIQFDGCPFIIVGRKVYDCQHGVDRHAKEKLMNQQKSGDGDHYVGPKKKLFKQTTKKLNCPATVVIRETLRFPDYKQFSKDIKHVSQITPSHLGEILIQLCGNEGKHPYLDEQGRSTLQFMRAAIYFIPFAMRAGADLRNASFIFAQPGREFVIKAGQGDWEFYFSQSDDENIHACCVRKPRLRYIWGTLGTRGLFLRRVEIRSRPKADDAPASGRVARNKPLAQGALIYLSR
ncbi:hypothetical protein OS493_031439 [Desmophyllum pertusum]|uniref:Uncharacterized protein n=1 Tax=Desmophyllum pertusum TaxID=174260 RepID=A0A9W9ZXU9_9CNID|nr:hypothetical protein OS493_031439 [Desmophyllum pertusum]